MVLGQFINDLCCTPVQVNSGFAFEGDATIIARQIRDRILQVKREKERKQLDAHSAGAKESASVPAQVPPPTTPAPSALVSQTPPTHPALPPLQPASAAISQQQQQPSRTTLPPPSAALVPQPGAGVAHPQQSSAALPQQISSNLLQMGLCGAPTGIVETLGTYSREF